MRRIVPGPGSRGLLPDLGVRVVASGAVRSGAVMSCSVDDVWLASSPVYACKLSDREHPLYLRLVAGPRTDTLSFVLREHEIGEWEAFSLPELQNFLRILDKEEDEQLQNLKERYAAYRHKLEEALGEAWKPG